MQVKGSIFKFVVLLSVAVSALPLLASGGSGGGTFAGVSLSVSKETAPADSIGQVKVFLTEPKPITTGGGSLTFDAYDSIFGIAVISPTLDVNGVALVHGGTIALSVVSPSATFGMSLDYPIITVAGHIPAGTPIGTKFPLAIDPASLQLYDSTGALYPVEVKNGHLITGAGVVISDVSPGSAVVPAGGVVTITGANFVPNTNIRFGDIKVSQVRYVSPTRIDVVIGQTARMHGEMIKASNPDNTQSIYYSYQRTRVSTASADATLHYAVPLLSPVEGTTWTVTLPVATAPTTFGVAVQNIRATGDAASAFYELLDGSGAAIASTTLAIPASTYAVQELGELFGAAAPSGVAVRVTATSPVEVEGIAVDQTTGNAIPILAK